MSPLETILSIYAFGLVLIGFLGGVYCGFGNPSQRRNGARVIILSPAWPAVVICAIPIGAMALWKLADWKGEA